MVQQGQAKTLFVFTRAVSAQDENRNALQKAATDAYLEVVVEVSGEGESSVDDVLTDDHLVHALGVAERRVTRLW